jgi:hypothetical protein
MLKNQENSEFCGGYIPRDGQTNSYAEGDGGYLQIGTPGPDNSFIDHGDGTVSDNLTGLMWTKNAQQIAGRMDWYEAITACTNLVFAGYDDWRLPNLKELLSLIDYGPHYSALRDGHPFVNVQSAYYWANPLYESNTRRTWRINMPNGFARSSLKDRNYYLWPVRGGN